MSKVKCLFEKIEYGTTLKRNYEERSRGGGFNLLAHYQVGKQSSGIQLQSKVHQVLGGWDSVFRSKNILELYLFVVSNKTISDGGITVDFWFIKVHTSN